ncbi:hypothetical protein OUZ56_016317 [Daphnia magna]|uniref:Uncharacterized protein n=1 Tax=Daphnia magna TaxID=35525 RepID=A0ABR0AQA8_9CRUS|nr:hypothetical protein OUZ56_016317 [Daphnia magna]
MVTWLQKRQDCQKQNENTRRRLRRPLPPTALPDEGSTVGDIIVQVSCLGKAFVCSNRIFISFLHISLFKLHLVTDINMVGGRGRASILSDLN